MSYKPLDSKLDIPKLEKEIQRFWKNSNAYWKRVEIQNTEDRLPWSFIDGPITANNPMGVHHAWGRTYKDLFARYKFMKGFKVRNQNGFDCQGLWVEVEVEKDLGFESKKDIEAYGISEFVIKCKQRVLEYSAIQTEQSIRLGMWTDWNDPDELRKLSKALETPLKETQYVGSHGTVKGTAEFLVSQLGLPEIGGSYYTFSDENNYMIWKALKSCHERNWIYKGSDVMPWCPRCSTGISEHEIVTEGYRELTHTSVYLLFRLKERKGSLLIWTTTPWTLTSNVAAAVHPELYYVKIQYRDEVLYLSKDTLKTAIPDLKNVIILDEIKGSELDGWKYHGPFDELPVNQKLGVPDAHRIIMWDEVSEEEGTGIVHIAPGAGKEDLVLGQKFNLPAPAPLDDYGVIIEGFGWLSGVHVYDSAEPIFEDLRKKDLLYRTQKYTHRYPVCWRCGSELVFRYVSEWFINMGEKLDKTLNEITPEEKENNLRYQIMESAKQVRWIPEFGLARELDWLRNMDDWMISKKRYWGLALPIWTCKCGWFDVIGSYEELKVRAIEGWEKFEGRSPHRPYIDEVIIKCEKCGQKATRIPDVGNPWLDAGIVAYSTVQYRKNREYWEKWIPAHFITESFPGQFRNWFYAMLAESTMLEKISPFKTCLGHGQVLAEDGREMHKSWGNAIWFDDAAEKMGADVMRWIYASSKPENNVLFGYTKSNETRRLFFMTYLNVYNFFYQYATLDKWTPDQKPSNISQLDKWILSKLNLLVKEVTLSLDNYDTQTATTNIERFVDTLSKWYIRRSRRRFWKTEIDDEKNAAYNTLYTCIKTINYLLAPILPHLSEALYQRMVKPVEPNLPESIHHCSWVDVNNDLIDEQLMSEMDLAMNLSSLGRAARNMKNIKLRHPLKEAIVIIPKQDFTRVEKVKELVKEELNVKNLVISTEKNLLFNLTAKPIASKLGRKHGREYPKIQAAIRNLGQNDIMKLQVGKPITIEIEDKILQIETDEVQIIPEPKEEYSQVEYNDLIVGVNIVINKDLEIEGLARDIVRRIQALRKEADFEIDDHIRTYYIGDLDIVKVFTDELEYIKTETLSEEIINGEIPKEAYTRQYEIDGRKVKLGLKKLK